MKLKEYVQSDDFLGQPLEHRQQWLSKQKGWEGLAPEIQRQYLTGFGKGDYKPRDWISKAYGFGLPLVGQYGGEAAGEAGSIAASPATGGLSLAAGPGIAALGGGAGAAAGSTMADFIDSLRGMGPKPTLKGEMKATPRRIAYGTAGSAMGYAAPKLIMRGKEGIAGTLEAVAGNPRYYTRALLEGKTKGVPGTPEAIGEASAAGEHAVAEFEAKAQNKVKDLKTQMGKHWVKQKYGDPLEKEFQPPEPEPMEPKEVKKGQQGYSEYVSKFNQWMRDHAEWEKSAKDTPKPTSNSLASIYNRYMKVIRERGKMPPEKEVPELVRVKRLAQSRMDFDKMNTEVKQKLTDDDLRRLGKITNESKKRIGFLDPKQADLENKLSEAYGGLEARKSSHAVKTFGGRGYPGRFQEKLGAEVARPAKTIVGGSRAASTERTMGELKGVEKETGTSFLGPAVNNMAKNYYSKVMPQGRQPWMRRMAIAAPMMLGTAIGTGKLSPYWASMLPLMAMMSPALAAQMLTKGARYGPEALSQFARSFTEKDPE